MGYIQHKGLKLKCSIKDFNELFDQEVVKEIKGYIDWYDALDALEITSNSISFASLINKKTVYEIKDITKKDIARFRNFIFSSIDLMSNKKLNKELKDIATLKFDFFKYTRQYWLDITTDKEI
ncbi:hypothetical protein [Mycoplasma sp. 2634B]|uniref:hypothetical protein n=1 Tax=Mycoplasma sp. 2634B TaxID=3401692 RepID=UPI003AB06D30